MISVASPELCGGNVTRGIVPILFDKEDVSASFGYHLMRSELVQSQIRAKTYGAALMQINIRDVRQLKVIYPNIKKQNSLAEIFDELLDQTKELESLYQQKINALAELKQSLLHQAFSGDL